MIEDDRETSRVMARLVRARGFSVVTAGSVAEARACVQQGNVGFLISDLGLPDGNACDLMAEVSASHGLKGAAISGFGMDADVIRSREAGFVFHLTKPIAIGDLEYVLTVARLSMASLKK
ncbi:MAG TPA: response regulator [Lacunisphaera sp.]|nr:response regulator [Lacunisphaera sp.]